MSQWNAVSPTDHRHLGWLPYTDYTFAAQDTFAPVVMEELAHLLAYYPLCFIQQAAGYQLVALQSLTPGVNIYVTPVKGQWLAPYVPARYRSYPFRLHASPRDPEKQLLCFDADYPGITSPGDTPQAQPFFNDQGQPSEQLSRVIDFLQKTHDNLLLTQKLVDQLQQAELIEPWPIQAQQDAEPISGLNRINEKYLQESEPQTISALAKTGALGLAYGQLYSQARLQDFQRRYQHRQQQQEQAEAKANVAPVVTIGDDDDILRFR